MQGSIKRWPPTVVSVGIQARSTSKRLPGKMGMFLQGRSVLARVVDTVNKAACYINSYSSRGILVDITLLVPFNDEIGVSNHFRIPVIYGDENDVLSRYVSLQKDRNSDYIVRVTGDCPLLPPFLISKLVTLAVTNQYDYVSNVDERCRTAPDGFDCEVLSRRLLKYAGENTKTPSDREHVTTFLRRNPPSWIRQGAIINFLDLSSLKFSVDTKEDLDRVDKEIEKVDKAYQTAIGVFGKNHVHIW